MARTLPLPPTASEVDWTVTPLKADGTPAGGSGTSSDQVQGAGPSGAAAVGNPVGVGGVYSSTLPILTDGQRGNLMQDLRGSLNVSLTQGGTPIGSVNGTLTDGFTNAVAALHIRNFPVGLNGSTWDRLRTIQGIDATGLGVQATANVVKSGAAAYKAQTQPYSTARLVSAAASTNATSVKTSAGDLFHVTGYNTNAAPRYLKLYNKASAPTVGTDTPIWTEYLPASSRFSFSFPSPMYFSTGIAFAITTAAADSDTGALTAGDVVALNIAYA
jgi:hypothetical protein